VGLAPARRERNIERVLLRAASDLPRASQRRADLRSEAFPRVSLENANAFAAKHLPHPCKMPAAFVVRALPSRSSKYHRPACPRRSPTRCGLDNGTVVTVGTVVSTVIGVGRFLGQETKDLKGKVEKVENKMDSMSEKLEEKMDEKIGAANEKLLAKVKVLLEQDGAKRDKAWEARLDALETRLVGMLEAFKPPFRNGIDGVQLTFAGSPEHHVVAPVFVGSPTTAAFQCARDLAPTRLRKVRLMSLATGHFLDEEESGGKTLGMDELSQGLRVFSGAGANSS